MLQNGYEVHISCENKRLPEFQPEQEDDKTRCCYVPSEKGKTFSVCYRDYPGANHYCVRFTIDGRLMRGTTCTPGHKGERWGIRSAVDVREPFQFSELVLNDDDSLITAGPVIDNLGTIRVEIHRIKPPKQSDYRPNFKSHSVLQVGPVNERSKKAGTHCVSFGPAKKCEPHRTVNSQPLVPGEGPVAVFIFRYRPQAILQAQGIISSVPPVTQGNKRKGQAPKDRPTSTAERKKRKMDRHSSSHNNRPTSPEPNIKAENSSAAVSRPRRSQIPLDDEVIDLTDVKRENSPIRAKTVHGEMIDLTLDD